MRIFEEVRPVALGRSLLSPDNLMTLYQACQKVEGLTGSIAEVGVYRGGSAKLMMTCLPKKDIWLFDTFTGIPANEANGHAQGDFAAPIDEVREFLRDGGFDNHTLVAGIFPESASYYETSDYGLDLEDFCLVHLDTDTYEGTLAGLKYFWPKMVQGGIALIHDYDWHACPGIKPAIEDFLETLDGGYTSEVVEVVGSIKYFKLVKTTPRDLEPEDEGDKSCFECGEPCDGSVKDANGESLCLDCGEGLGLLKESNGELPNVKVLVDGEEITGTVEEFAPLMECTECGHPNEASATVCVECDCEELQEIPGRPGVAEYLNDLENAEPGTMPYVAPHMTHDGKVEVFRDRAWTPVENLAEVKTGELFRAFEADGVTFGHDWIAMADGYIGEGDVYVIACEEAVAELGTETVKSPLDQIAAGEVKTTRRKKKTTE